MIYLQVNKEQYKGTELREKQTLVTPELFLFISGGIFLDLFCFGLWAFLFALLAFVCFGFVSPEY